MAGGPVRYSFEAPKEEVVQSDEKKIRDRNRSVTIQLGADVPTLGASVEKPVPRGSVGCLLVGSMLGEQMYEDTKNDNEFHHLVTTGPSGKKHVTIPLIEVQTNTTVVDMWRTALKEVVRLGSETTNLFIASNPDNHDEFVVWARQANFPLENIIPVSSESVLGATSDFLKATNWENHLIVVDMEHVCTSEVNMQKFVEHATIRGKDCVSLVTEASTSILEWAPLTTTVEVEGLESNPKIKKITETNPGCEGKGLGPATYFRSTTLPLILKGYADDSSLSVSKLLTSLIADNHQLYGIPISVTLMLRQTECILYAHAFFEFLSKKIFNLKMASKTAANDPGVKYELFVDNSDLANADPEPEADDGLLIDVEALKRDFDKRYTAMLSYSKLEQDRHLPERFANVSLWKHAPRQEHPVYQTSNNAYGLKTPAQQQMALKYWGIRGNFTTNFPCTFKDTGFNTTRTTSKVHREYDDF